MALVEGRDGVALGTAAVEIVHGDVEIDFATGSLDAENHGFGVYAAGEAGFAHVNFRRKDLEAKTLVVEQGDAVADDHVGEFADRFANSLFALREFGAGKLAGNAHGDLGCEVENHAPFDVALDGNERGDALAA